ncbi:hypothetical protein PF005_g3314 [Phytophthora fragariae]|uniref:Winged helix-turn helix domain-containing protein n=2 Tax=Phytophthora fragariae TaxID=53985 RepID=A0A6A3Z825_9STRA|nr:hypothetical protein PF003_g554 [Phytophthora fragariae]KAE9229979.1 hypothetical protein PF002_g13147 [Phytophthora fragariae]KAE9230858.1 hypothetical protein PF005_g3314 [Phytophthora fragariae]KAE9253393.1 hypothetical protein PF004_g1526 [Phytophthora fragariae]
MASTMPMREELSPSQKTYMARYYTFMVIAKEGGVFKGHKTRDLVANCLGIAHGIVTTVMMEYNANKESSFVPKLSQRGKDRTLDPEVLEPVIHSYIDAQNRPLYPVTAQKFINQVKNECNVSLELRTMQRLRHELDFHYIVGKKRHISADTPANVEFRNVYLNKKLSNRRPEKK